MTQDTTTNQGNVGVNPFSFSLKFNCRLESSIESSSALAFKVRENIQSVLIYPEAFFEVYNQLSKPAQEVLQYILCKIRWEQDKLELKPDKIGMSKTPFYNGIAKLIECGILANAQRASTYWINPTFFFRGSRVTYYPEAITFSTESDLNKKAKDKYVHAAQERRKANHDK